MKILLITERLDQDSGLFGFFHAWVAEFARQCDQVTVIALSVGRYDLPENVQVYSLGKDKKHSSGFNRVQYMYIFYKSIIRQRNSYDYVFIHMHPVYIFLAAPLWKLWGKKIALWYAHGSVSWRLRVAERLVDVILTSTQNGCRLSSAKIRIVGQGIDTDLFDIRQQSHQSEYLSVVTVGRLSPSKHLKEIIEIFSYIVGKVPARLFIVGEPATATDEKYLHEIHADIKQRGLEELVVFEGSVANKDLPACLQQQRVFMSASTTDSLDKTLLEAMACGLTVFSPNASFVQIAQQEGYPDLIYSLKDPADRVAQQIVQCVKQDSVRSFRYRAVVCRDHSLNQLVRRICREISGEA